MSLDIANLLNCAACGKPKVMIPANFSPRMSTQDSKELFESALTVSLQTLRLAFQDLFDNEKLPLMYIFRRRVSKLLLSMFLSCSSEVRNCFIEPVMEHILVIISCSDGLKLSYKNRYAVKWLLAIAYNVLCCKSPGYGAILASLNRETEARIMDVSVLSVDQRTSCLASGGITTTKAGSEIEALEGCIDLNSVWNVDYQANELCRCNLQTLLGISDSSQHMLTAEPCRQLVELIFTVYCRFYEENSPILYQIVEEINVRIDKPFIYEAIMRLIQLCLPYFGTKANWITLTKHLLAEGLVLGNSIQNNLGSQPLEDEIAHVVILTRTLCLLSRYSIVCIPSDDMESSTMKLRCIDALGHLNQFLCRPSNWGQEISRNQLMLCIRLAAAYSLAWLLQEPVFPEDVLATHAENLLYNILLLIQDVKECETQIYLLTVLRNLIQRIDLISFPQLTSPILSTLDHLWSLSGQSAALRANILDTVCLLVTELNASNENVELLPEFNALIRSPVIGLIQMSLSQVKENSISGSETLFEPGLRLWLVWSKVMVQYGHQI
ncbi:unnamed protein product [Heterobilharzia americana]|nr:unnamed protein product [Heterobilharzia americana]